MVAMLCPVSTLLVDDSRPFRDGLRNLLNFFSTTGNMQFRVVGEAATADQAMSLIRNQRPSLVLLDMELVNSDGINVLSSLLSARFSGKVLALSAHREDEWVFRAMQAGAWGYVCKDHIADQLFEAISTILHERIYLSPEIATGFFRLFHYQSGQSLRSAENLNLTAREQEVLQWLVSGASNDTIAQNLHITVATVKAHLTGIFEKLSVKSRTQAIVKALKLGLVSS